MQPKIVKSYIILAPEAKTIEAAETEALNHFFSHQENLKYKNASDFEIRCDVAQTALGLNVSIKVYSIV